MNRSSFLVVAAVLAAAAPAGAAPRKPPQGGRLSVAARPTPLTFGQGTVVSGKLTGQNNGGQPVTLSEDPFPYGGGFLSFARGTTRANGNFAFPLIFPATNRNYRVTVGTQQAFTGVRVRMRVSFAVGDSTPNRGQRVGFTGFVAPKHDGRTVLIQRRSATGSWGTVLRTLLKASTGNRSHYGTSLVIRRTGTYRVRAGSDGDHLTGTSRTRTLSVG
jgi:hypothetical protein